MKTKTIFISAFLLFASVLCLRAQGTYEYAAVTLSHTSTAYYLGVSTSDNYIETKVKSKFETRGNFSDLSLLLEKVNELTKEGWEVYSTSASGIGEGYVTYHLRRKKP